VTDVRPLASRAARRGSAAPSLPSRTRAAHTDEGSIESRGNEDFLARVRESASGEAGVDESTLSAIEERLRNV
jgi:hypothetical protein